MTSTVTIDSVATFSPPLVRPNLIDTLRQGRVFGPSLMWSSTWEDPEAGRQDSISSWRTTHTGWNTQSTSSVESPVSPRGLLAAAAVVRNRGERRDDKSQQSWFLPSDRGAKKAFGYLERKLGLNRASVEHYSHIAMPIEGTPPHDDDLLVVPSQNNYGGRQDDLIHLVTGTRGFVYVTSEELDHEDVNLQALDDEYRQVGQRRYRRIWLAYSRVRRAVVGAAIAYRGPREFDFGWLANRCDIVIHPMLSEQTTASVARLLMASAGSVYNDFRSETIPVITDGRTGAILTAYRGQWIRNVGLAIVLNSAYEDWCHHLSRSHKKRRQSRGPFEYRKTQAIQADLVSAAA